VEPDKPIELHIRNQGGLPLPGVIQGIMYLVFSFPLIVIPMTVSEVGKNPKVLLFWPLMFIPLGVMYLLRRAFSRFAMTLYRDGSIKITQPFNSQSIAREQLSVIVAKANNAHIGGSSAPIPVAIRWLFFFDASHKELARVSPSGYAANDVNNMLAAIGRLRPDVKIEHQ